MFFYEWIVWNRKSRLQIQDKNGSINPEGSSWDSCKIATDDLLSDSGYFNNPNEAAQ